MVGSAWISVELDNCDISFLPKAQLLCSGSLILSDSWNSCSCRRIYLYVWLCTSCACRCDSTTHLQATIYLLLASIFEQLHFCCGSCHGCTVLMWGVLGWQTFFGKFYPLSPSQESLPLAILRAKANFPCDWLNTLCCSKAYHFWFDPQKLQNALPVCSHR